MVVLPDCCCGRALPTGRENAFPLLTSIGISTVLVLGGSSLPNESLWAGKSVEMQRCCQQQLVGVDLKKKQHRNERYLITVTCLFLVLYCLSLVLLYVFLFICTYIPHLVERNDVCNHDQVICRKTGNNSVSFTYSPVSLWCLCAFILSIQLVLHVFPISCIKTSVFPSSSLFHCEPLKLLQNRRNAHFIVQSVCVSRGGLMSILVKCFRDLSCVANCL